jgi:hypothetical protein
MVASHRGGCSNARPMPFAKVGGAWVFRCFRYCNGQPIQQSRSSLLQDIIEVSFHGFVINFKTAKAPRSASRFQLDRNML